MFLDIYLSPGKQFIQKIPKAWHGMLFVYKGESLIYNGESPMSLEQATVFESKNVEDTVKVMNEGNEQCRFILIAGEILNEPIAKHGPFVMNTKAEIQQTMLDYKNGQNGFEGAHQWESKIQHMASDVNYRPK